MTRTASMRRAAIVVGLALGVGEHSWRPGRELWDPEGQFPDMASQYYLACLGGGVAIVPVQSVMEVMEVPSRHSFSGTKPVRWAALVVVLELGWGHAAARLRLRPGAEERGG